MSKIQIQRGKMLSERSRVYACGEICDIEDTETTEYETTEMTECYSPQEDIQESFECPICGLGKDAFEEA